MEDQSGYRPSSLRRRHMGLVGAIIILAQAITHYSNNHSNKNIAEELRQIRADQEKLFAKKEELAKLSSKLDFIRHDLMLMNNKIGIIRPYVFNGHNGTSQF